MKTLIIIYIRRSILPMVLVIIPFIGANAQWQATGNTTDFLLQPLYTDLISTNGTMALNAELNKIALKQIKEVIDDELEQLTRYNREYVEQGSRIKTFIREKSYDFIKEKYPILEPNGSSEFLKNSLIRARFRFKLESEYKKARSYLALDNYISEGDRILLVLSSLEKVIKTCMEHEEF